MPPKSEPLFSKPNKAHYGEQRRLRPLFLPKSLRKDSHNKRLKDDQYHRAYEILCKWADLESSDKLPKEKETSLEGEFLVDVFGNGLGYVLFSDNKDRWDLRPKFSVQPGQADAAIGQFGSAIKSTPRAVIELKGPTANLDKDRFNGRTPVQQCWDYLDHLADCPWGIVSNFVSFRLYHRDNTPRVYELFVLQDLQKPAVFEQFYYLFARGGLLPEPLAPRPRADLLLEKCITRERQVGDELYTRYDLERKRLIMHLLSPEHDFTLDKAIRITQKLLDRIIFVAFCEDRNLLPGRSLKQAWEQVPPFARVTNPRWQNFLALFQSIDEGNVNRNIPPYNGGLFSHDPDVDNLQLDDEWTDFFKAVGDYDFAHEVNVDILGHLFEKSINDIQKIRLAGLFESEQTEEPRPRMRRSAERKKGGIYYTPPEFTGFMTASTVKNIAEDRIKLLERNCGIRLDQIDATTEKKRVTTFAEAALEELRDIKVVDPACGSGAFLIRAYDLLEEKYEQILDVFEIHEPALSDELRNKVSDFILHDNLFGVDLSPEAVEITQLALWLRTANRQKSLADLSKNIVCGNSLISDTAVDPLAIDWQETFPDIFSRPNPGFDCVIGNPPWERMKLQEREFFDTSAPNIASATNAADRRQLIEKLQKTNPDLYQKYIDAKTKADSSLAYIRNCKSYPLTGKGDINYYPVFAELAHSIVSRTGCVGLLVPTGIVTHKTNEDFFAKLVNSRTLSGLYDFENRKGFFPDVHRSEKFSVLLFGGSQNKSKSADFVFFAHTMKDRQDKKRHVSLSSADFKLLNPNTRTCPIFRFKRDANLTKYIYKRVPILVNETRKQGGNPWGIKFLRMFDQTNDAELFRTADQLKATGFKCEGSLWKKRKEIFLPLYEAKMVQMFDHRAASVIINKENWFRQGQTDETSLVQHQNPEFSVQPRWWASKDVIDKSLGKRIPPALLAFKNVTSSTNQRTMIAAFIPPLGVINSAPLFRFDKDMSPIMQCCLLANLNSFVLDYVARQKIGDVNLNFFYIKQFSMYHPDFYRQKCPWDKKHTLDKWISDRVLKLTCTSNDMIPLAQVAGFKPTVHKWDPAERFDLMAQLDAAYFLLYGIKRNDVEYILSTFQGLRKESDDMFASDTTASRILEHYDKLKRQPKS